MGRTDHRAMWHTDFLNTGSRLAESPSRTSTASGATTSLAIVDTSAVARLLGLQRLRQRDI